MKVIWEVGDKVLTDIGEAGTISLIRPDDLGHEIIQVSLDNPQATPSGLYYARWFELKVRP